MAKSTVEFLVKVFRSCPAVCFKTGSRRFGYASPDSDYDFAADANKLESVWRDFLNKEGFVEVFREYPVRLCDDTATIYEKSDSTGKMQIVFSRNYKRKERIFLWLDERPHLVKMYYSVPKNERHKIWKRLHELAAEGKI